MSHNIEILRAHNMARREAAEKAVLAALETAGESGVTQAEIAAATGVSVTTVHRRLVDLRAKGKTHIWTWRLVFKTLVPVYRLGAGPDAERHERSVADAEGEDPEAAARAETRSRHAAWESKWRAHRDAAAAWI
ncbi:MarR family transcriptional regulator [Ralstonia nicotianae]|uniref:MarR family transcriptional regulator n=1 Tax=Ralstonia nicotianae TaxID=3037696 RepID=UPI00030EF9F0